MNPAIQGLITIVLGVGGCLGYFWASNQILDKVLFPARGPNIGRNINRANMIRPWLFMLPAMVALGLYLAYPVFETLRLSLTERVPIPGGGGAYTYEWVGGDNYVRMMGEPKFWEALRNNFFWLLVVPAMSTVFGLLVAQLSDRLSWGNIAKSMIFMPMAISFVGASIIWRFMYIARPPQKTQTGVMNAVWIKLGQWSNSPTATAVIVAILVLILVGILFIAWRGRKAHMPAITAGAVVVALPIVWLIYRFLGPGLGGFQVIEATGQTIGQPILFLQEAPFNNFWMMVVLIWIQTGFAMVILSAAIKAVPTELIEASRIDGASESQVFWRITIPQVSPTIGVVVTTLVVTVLKVFDIPKVMTNGNFGTQVLANEMWQRAFTELNFGLGSAIAIVLFLGVLPIMWLNIRRMQKERAAH